MNNNENSHISSLTSELRDADFFDLNDEKTRNNRAKLSTISKRLKRVDDEEVVKRFVGTRSGAMNTHLRIRNGHFNTFVSRDELLVEESHQDQSKVESKNVKNEETCLKDTKNEFNKEAECVEDVKEKQGKKSFFKPVVDFTELMNDEHYFSYYFNKLLIKYVIFAFTFTFALGSNLNRSPFGFARLTFSQSAWLILRIIFFGVLIDLVTTWILAKFKSDQFDKLFFVESSLARNMVIPFVIANLLIYQSLSVGFVCGIVAIVYSIWVHANIYKDIKEYSNMNGFAYAILRYVIIVACVFVLIQLFGSDMLRIINSFI